MKRSLLVALAACIILSGCGVKKKDTADSPSSEKEAMQEQTEVFGSERVRYEVDIEGRKISFSSVPGLKAMDPQNMTIVETQSFYSEDAKHCITVTYVTNDYPDETIPKTAEEYMAYDGSDTVTPVEPQWAEDITIGEWTGYSHEYKDLNMDFYAGGYELFNEAGERVWFSQNKKNDGYLPIEEIEIE